MKEICLKTKKMKKLIITLSISSLCYLNTFSQCTLNSLYQDSSFGIWPTVDINLPTAVQGQFYLSTIDIKTPTTLIEASGGDSALTSFDTLGQTFYVGDWVVDDFELVSVTGLPNGITLDCYDPNCIILGNTLSCAYFSGTTNDPLGTYPIDIAVNVNTHGDIVYYLGPIPITVPVTTDLYSATRSYQYITGYEIEVSNTASENLTSKINNGIQISSIGSRNYLILNDSRLLNSNGYLELYDISGKLILSKNINSFSEKNMIEIEFKLKKGAYFVNLVSENIQISKKFIISR